MPSQLIKAMHVRTLWYEANRIIESGKGTIEQYVEDVLYCLCPMSGQKIRSDENFSKVLWGLQSMKENLRVLHITLFIDIHVIIDIIFNRMESYNIAGLSHQLLIIIPSTFTTF